MSRKEEAKIELRKLIDFYKKYKDDKEFADNESQICDSLIKPFFNKVLGWDTNYPNFIKEAKKSGKRIDYLVKKDGISQFVIEAKSLSHDIIDNPRDYKQAIGYGHSKEKNYAILTNFHYFIVLNCGVESPNPLQARVNSCIDITDISEQAFDFIWNFSFEVWSEKGEKNEELKLKTNLKRRKKVDELLLEDMKRWRISLLNNLKKHPNLNKFEWKDEKERNYIEEEVQKYIDRLIFICFCEDKELSERELRSLIEEKNGKYFSKKTYLLDKIRILFKNYRNTFNSDLFMESGCDKFYLEDGIICKILRDLRIPLLRLPYDFASIEVDILGKAYENFLGHILAGKQKLKEKESKGKRKESGIYYTPRYVVSHIVDNTLREYIKNKDFEEIKKVKILDPACGSGSFLIRAFDVLIEESQIRLKRELTYEERKGLLLSCIFGVDKDERACDIAKLNLSLKLAERGKKLPELHNNIKNGDSIIDNEKIVGYKAFNWNEGFKEIINEGGFDIVVGNPPYISNWQLSETDRNMVLYLEEKYSDVTLGHWDIYILFIKKALDLLKQNGLFSFIVPSSFSKEKYGKKLREIIINNYFIASLAEFGTESVFKEVARQYVVFVINKNQSASRKTDIVYFKDLKFEKSHQISQRIFLNFHNFTFRTDVNNTQFSILTKIASNTSPIGNICCVNVGVVAHSKEDSKKKFKKERVIHNQYKKGYEKYIEGKDISRYSYSWKGLYIDYDSNINNFHRPKFPELFENNKIIIRRVSGEHNSIISVYDNEQFYTNDNLIIILPWDDDMLKLQSIEKKWTVFKPYNYFSLKYILGILNSKLISFYFSKKIATGTLQGTYSGVYPEDIRLIPIKQAPNNQQQLLIKLVDKMLSLNKNLSKIGDRITDEKNKIQAEIRKTDLEIDKVVYKLYGLTDSEIKIVENSI